VNRWLDQAAIPQPLRAPFLLPVQCAYRLGLTEVEGAVSRASEGEIVPTTEPFFYRFPFDRTSALDASGVDVQAVLGPKGSFLQTFDAVVRPVVDDLGQGRFAPKTAYPGRTVAVPTDLLDLARFAAQLRSALWTDDGQPRPLALSVQPLPLRSPSGPVTTTLSSLRAGKATVFGFNQTPSWHAVQVTWGAQDTASVALRANAAGSAGGESYHSIDAGPSDWAFLRLLAQAQTTNSVLGTVTASWSLPVDASGAPPQLVSFSFQSDPWRPFQGAPTLK
jgi:type VI protein secretion system component VasK